MDELKKLLETDKVLFGKETTMKALKLGQLQKLFLTSNLDAESLKDVDYYSSISPVETEVLKMTNEELGNFCRKSFSISMIGIKK